MVVGFVIGVEKDDVISAALFLADYDDAKVAERFIDAVERTYVLLFASPHIGAPTNISTLEYTRRFLVDGFPTYAVYYLPTITNGVIILRVLHTSRDHTELM